jgi:hypothetical protein
MPVAFKNLSGDLQAAIGAGYPDVGQVHYLVDSNYRTAAQGWTKADGTGPLDIWAARNPGYVFRTGDYATDAAAMQAANDALVDFRGDTLYFTPGTYLPLAAVAVDVPDARWCGSPVANPVAARATIQDGVGACLALTTAADRMEFGFLRFVPITASHLLAIATGADNLYFHDFMYDSRGVAANVATQLILAAGTMNNSVFERFYFCTDAAQGPLVELDGTAVGVVFKDFIHLHSAGTIANALLAIDGAGSTCIQVGPGHGQIGGDGVVQALVTQANLTAAGVSCTIKNFTGSVGYATNATLHAASGEAAEADIVDSWLATICGGAGRAAYIGTA